MEETSLDFENLCRTCMSTLPQICSITRASNHKRCIYENAPGISEGGTLMELLQAVQPDIHVDLTDKLPKRMCNECIEQLKATHEFLQMCKETHEKFRKMLKEVETTTATKSMFINGRPAENPNLDEHETEHLQEYAIRSSILKSEIEMHKDDDIETNIAKNDQRPEFESMFINHKSNEENSDDAFDLSDNPFNNEEEEHDDNEEWTLKKNMRKRKYVKKARNVFNSKINKTSKQKAQLSTKKEDEISMEPPSENEDGCISCRECEKVFENSTLWKEHMTIQHNSGEDTQKRRRKNNAKQFECEYCGKVFHRKSIYNTHILIHTGNFHCLECGKKCKSYDDLNLHMLCHKGERFECEKCKKEFPTTDEYNDHVLTHKGDEPLQCKECSKTFKSTLGLRTHMLRHKGEKNFQCPHCPRKFVVRSGLYGHVKQQHEEGTPHLCDICGKGFRLADTLNKHKRCHSEGNFACEYCDKRFITGDKQRRHMRIHTGEKPYRCKYCDRAYSQSSERNKHMIQHLGKNIFRCELCPLRFPLLRDVRAHFASHKDEDEETRARNLEARALEEKLLQIKLSSS